MARQKIEYTRLIAMSDASDAGGSGYYQPFWEITRAYLRYYLEQFALPLTAANEEVLMGQYAKLVALPENLNMLRQLKMQGMATAILSNGSVNKLESAVASAGMSDYLDKVIAVEKARTINVPCCYRS